MPLQSRPFSSRACTAAVLPLCVLSSLLAACGGGGGGDETGVVDDPPASAATEPCGAITIARMNWASAEAIAEIDRLILDEGFGCEATLVEGDTLPTFRSMVERGEPDLAPALWFGSFDESFDAAVAAGEIVAGAETLRDGGVEGWWIPRAVAEANPDIRTIEDALTRPELFPASSDGAAGAIHNCPVGWNCQVTNENLFRAYGADAMGFVLVDTESAAGLDESVESAVREGRGWLGYYWSPTALIGRIDLVRLDTVPHDPAEWARCTTLPDCPDPAPTDYPRSEVRAVVSPDFVANADVAMDYVARRGWDNDTVSAVLAWMADNEADGEEAARYFLRNFEDVWTSWVDEETATRVRAAL